MKNTPENVEKLIFQLEESGFDVKPYLKRLRFKDKCVSVRNQSPWDIAKALWFRGEFSDVLNVDEPYQDRLSMGTVVYWPKYTWPEEEQ